MYEIVLEEYYQPAHGGRSYQSERVVKTMLSLIDAKLETAELNTQRIGNQYFFYREIKDSK